MRICFVNDYSLDHIGGAPTSMLEQMSALKAAGHEVMLLQLGKESRKAPSNTIHIPGWLNASVNGFDLPILPVSRNSVKRVMTILSQHKIDIVHFQSELSLSHTALTAAKKLGIPTVYTVHTFFWHYPSERFQRSLAIGGQVAYSLMNRRRLLKSRAAGRPVERLLKNMTFSFAQQCDVVISPSEHQCDIMQAAGLETACEVIPNPYTHPPHLSPPRLADKNAPLRIAWIGRCAPEKRPLVFAQAIKLAAADPRTHFEVDIVGTGEQLEQMKRSLRGVSNITFHHQLPRNEVIEVIDKASIVALTSYRFDNQPMIIAEGISRYRPILYCDDQLKEGVTEAGYLTEDETAEGIAKAITHLAQNSSTLYELSQKAKRASRLFTREGFVAKVEDVYRSILEDK